MFAIDDIGKNTHAARHMIGDGLLGDAHARSDLALRQTFDTLQNDSFTAARRQLVESGLQAAKQITREDASLGARFIRSDKALATRKSFAQDILIAIREFGFETGPDIGTENILQERVRVCLRAVKNELLIVDEFQHLASSRNEHVIYAVGEMIKWMLIKGVCPIVMSGTDDALKPFGANPQLVRRAIPSVDLSPLSIDRAADKAIFADFLAYFLDAMERHGVAKNAMSLLSGDVPACLLEISGGVLGLVCKLLEDAVRLMTYAGRIELARDDLIRAADDFRRDKKSQSNPFVDGLKPLKLAA